MKKIAGSFPKEKTRAVLGSALRLLPVLLALRVVEPFSAVMLAAVLLLWVPMELAQLPITGLSLILLQDIAARHSTADGILSSLVYLVLAGSILLFYLLREKNDHIRTLCACTEPPQGVYPGLSLGAAVLMTCYQCSGYFAVGAHGAGLFTLLRSYRNLGFHPNWRTVLYSTIMLVILITWPRKFKKLAKTLPGSFVGIAVVTGLNILLNPNPARSTVAELGISWLPILNRMPISALSMLLIFLAWEEVPFKRLKACLQSKNVFQWAGCAAVPVAMLCFDLLWVLAALALVWDAACVARRRNAEFFVLNAE